MASILSVPKKLGGSIKIKVHRPIEGAPKTAHLVLRADGHWYALIVCETEPHTEHSPNTCEHPDIGIDVGLKSFLTDSEGHTVENPRYYRKSQVTLRRKQRTIARRKKGSKRRRKAAKSTAPPISRSSGNAEISISRLPSSTLNSITILLLRTSTLMGWSRTIILLNHHGCLLGRVPRYPHAKAESAGHEVIRVNPRYTSQKCYRCGEIVQKSLSVRTHICPHCGYVEDRDVNAAKNILKSARPGHGLQALTYTDGCSVA